MKSFLIIFSADEVIGNNLSHGKNTRTRVLSFLWGERVALEWKDKRETVLLDELKTIFEYISFCPKVEVDMGVPREPVQLIGNKEKMNKK